VFERLSVARDHEILIEALRHGRGGISHSELRGMLWHCANRLTLFFATVKRSQRGTVCAASER
jgi:hypothetical protein